MQQPDEQRRSIWRRGMDAVFGYDFFISYSWHDGGAYAAALLRRLELQGFDVFLDRNRYASGDDWKQVGAWTLRRTGQLILVGSTGALTSAPVAREVDIFGRTGRRIIPIDFDGSLDRLAADAPLRRHLQDEILRIRERPLALTEGPSDETLSTIRRTFTLVRQDKKRLIILGVATVIMAALAAVSFAFGGYALSQKAVAEENARQTFLRQADLSASIAFRLFGEGRPVLGFKVARAGAPDVIQHATPLTKRLALALSRGWRQIQEEADLRHADGDVMNAAWSPDGSRVVTSTLTDAPRAWSVANGEQLAVLGNGIRPDYYLVRDPSDLSFSADGRRLATQFGDTVSVWETATWARVLDVHCEAMEGRYLRLSPDGRSLAAQCKDGVHLWEITSKREMYHRDEAVQPDGVLPWLAAFEFADEGDTLVLVDDKSAAVGVLRHITTGTPEFASLTQVSSEVQRNAPAQGDQGFVSVHPTRVPAEIVLRSTNAVYRVDLVQDRIAWQMPFAADQKHWFQMLRSADAIATASLANDGDVEYRIARGPGGRALQEGRMHYTGENVGARTNVVSFQDSGGGLGVALNTGVLVVAFGRNAAAKADDAFDFSGGGLQMLKGAAELVHSGPCAGAATEANKISLVADGSRMIVTCSGGGARMVRLREKPASRLAGVGPVARFGGALVRLGGTGEHKWFEVLDVSGKVSEHSDTTGEAIKYWVAAENGSAALSVGSSGTVRSWRPDAPGLVTYGVQLADIRAARFAPDGSRAALLDKNGVFARIRIGEATPEFVGRLGGPVVPAIDFSIDRTLSHVAFTTADRNVADEATDPRPQVDNSFAVVATPGKDEAQFGCRHVESSHYAAALFSDSTGPTVIYLVKRDRVVEKLVLNRGTSDATGLTPCPAGLLDAPPGLIWEINPFTHESVRVVEAAGADRADSLVFGGASDNPLELIDLASQRPITDLTPISGGNRALVLSADGRYLAALGDTARTIDIFDITTGSLLCRVRTEQAVANDRNAVLFARDNQVLLVRLMSGITIAYVIALRDGEDLLEQVKSVGIGPVTDDERREIYDIRQRFSRPTAYGALSLVPSPRA